MAEHKKARRASCRHRLPRAALRRRARQGHPRDRSHPRLERLPVDREGARQGAGGEEAGKKKLPVVQVTETPAYIYDHDAPRVRIGARHTAYVKIAEGCDRPCAFCIIPKLRGPQRSRAIADIVAEARAARARAACVEINLIAQDLTRYGHDAGTAPADRQTLAQLLRALGKVDELRLDPPPLHVPERVRRRADRRDRERAEGRQVRRRAAPAHQRPDAQAHAARPLEPRHARARRRRCARASTALVLRTTFIVGHPGETDAEFDELCEFVAESKFDRAGAFTYSIEPGTVSAMLPNRVDPDGRRRAPADS